ncbi:PIN domain-containing protein [Roseospira navarrensis]|uniref:PIN domain-containing protein n=1 Tax=Roseospira navarrensis TaxID=140058 RepID=A0A7X2D6Q7_9PROT|nr:type II toxin-antitoxin system VapC family toxin [Roseospira navarrensis]MQX38500.1 PIN domain-containing protein [Roseospira navarrensis]
MIALDTNLLVRYITQDDDAQSPVATGVIEDRCTPDAPGWISLVVLCELVWVLSRAYRYDKAQIADVLDRLLATAELRVEQEELARAALAGWRTSGADFADHVILESARAAGALPLVTLDRRLGAHSDAALAPDIVVE